MARQKHSRPIPQAGGDCGSEFGCGTSHLPTAVAAAFHVARTLAIHLALVLTDAELGEVHAGAGALLFKDTFVHGHSRCRGGDLTSL